ncbi:phosphopantothenate--cysteine ligase [Plasmodium cynomolgi strain B]|uniref:Phosphopantothenate--cysteine ligase n=1 Tax=Plasmodium cynomolgi (strain B) TaxID=1120755 RepID=K6UPX3_PLACD|nr:phosphopantothenate--cysteine ligase [Plasmodium cynomolgi strain B]GAB64784.1 phosphopantothenate--cysteine ligase [Plasmodium cynomolgi strain B]
MECLAEHPEFFASELRPNDLNDVLKKIQKEFLQEERNHIILITSGGTKVPLEKTSIRHMDNFSTGKRGAYMCEYFLKKNKKVIFLHRKGTFMPFEYHLKCVTRMESIRVVDGHVMLNLSEQDNNAVVKDAKLYEQFRQNLLCIPFESVFDYGFYLTAICDLLNKDCKGRQIRPTTMDVKAIGVFPLPHLVILCAAVSDFYIPFSQLSDHKINSESNASLSLRMQLAPKFYKLTRKYFPLLHFCMFKLEDDEEALLSKSNERIRFADILVANLLDARRDHFFKLTTSSESERIEDAICRYLFEYFAIPVADH